MKHLFYLGLVLISFNLIAEDCPEETSQEKLLAGLTQVPLLPLNNGPATPEVYAYSERYLGFSYFIGKGNERYEKLEGYEDIYLMIDQYEPQKHPLNRLFMGSHAVIKYDRSTNPPTVIYLAQEKHVATKPFEEVKNYKEVSETLCSLNKTCSGKLSAFNTIIENKIYAQNIAGIYKNQMAQAVRDNFIKDTYHKNPVIRNKIDQTLVALEKMSFNSPDEVDHFIKTQVSDISKNKLKGIQNFSEYREYLKKQNSKADPLEFYDYRALVSNLEAIHKRYHQPSKKNAFYAYCATTESNDCLKVNSLRQDLDNFESRRKPIPDLP